MPRKILKPHQVEVLEQEVVIGERKFPATPSVKEYASLADFATAEDARDTQDAPAYPKEMIDEASALKEETHAGSMHETDMHKEGTDKAAAINHDGAEEISAVADIPDITEDHGEGGEDASLDASVANTDVASSNMPHDAVPDIDMAQDVSPRGEAQQVKGTELPDSETDARIAELQRENDALHRRILGMQDEHTPSSAPDHRIEKEEKRIIATAEAEGEQIVANAQAQAESIRKEAQAEGHRVGHEEGFEKGYARTELVTTRMREITGKILQKRREIVEGLEKEVVELVLLIAKKVIKIISQESKEIIVENVRQALQMIRKKGEIIIRINPIDLELSSETLKKLTDSMEYDGTIQFIEDGLIARGGCVIESEFGEVDARIQNQILEIENKIRAEP